MPSTAFYPLSLHDALPILGRVVRLLPAFSQIGLHGEAARRHTRAHLVAEQLAIDEAQGGHRHEVSRQVRVEVRWIPATYAKDPTGLGAREGPGGHHRAGREATPPQITPTQTETASQRVTSRAHADLLPKPPQPRTSGCWPCRSGRRPHRLLILRGDADLVNHGRRAPAAQRLDGQPVDSRHDEFQFTRRFVDVRSRFCSCAFSSSAVARTRNTSRCLSDRPRPTSALRIPIAALRDTALRFGRSPRRSRSRVTSMHSLVSLLIATCARSISSLFMPREPNSSGVTPADPSPACRGRAPWLEEV